MSARHKEEGEAIQASMQTLARLRRMLSAVKRVNVTARGSDGALFRGSGDVSVRPLSHGGLSVAERGEWAPDGGPTLRFSNTCEWRFDETRGTVRLAHTRFGDDRPIHLADLTSRDRNTWVSEAPHICLSDSYLARVRIGRSAVTVRWRVSGPHKRQIIRSVYHPLPIRNVNSR